MDDMTIDEFMDDRTLMEILDDPVWDIHDSITQVKRHALKLAELGALSNDEALQICDILPERPELPNF